MIHSGVYVVVNLQVLDEETYSEYRRLLVHFLTRYQGVLLASDDSVETLEGSSPIKGRCVIIRFPSESVVRELWGDPEYQRIALLRRRGTTTHFMSLVKPSEKM